MFRVIFKNPHGIGTVASVATLEEAEQVRRQELVRILSQGDADIYRAPGSKSYTIDAGDRGKGWRWITQEQGPRNRYARPSGLVAPASPLAEERHSAGLVEVRTDRKLLDMGGRH